MAENDDTQTVETPQEAPQEERLISFQYDGETYQVTHYRKWRIEAFEKATEGDIVGATMILLGREQWDKFRASHEEFGQVIDFWAALGRAAGNS